MPRGKKECPKCKQLIGARASKCNHCGEVFSATKPKKQAKPFFRERKQFVIRMLDGEKSEDMSMDMMVATQVFKWFDNDIEFLSKVKPPFKFKNSIRYLRSKDGRKYLEKKHREYLYLPKNQEDFVEQIDKIGEDIVQPKIRTLRDFLNGSKKEN